MAFLALALGIWIWGTVRYGVRTRATPAPESEPATGALDRRRGAVLGLVLVAFGTLVAGVLRAGWGFNEMAALFFLMGAVAGIVGGLGVSRTAEAFVAGFRSMAYAAMLIGFARAIFVALDQGRIVDTIVHGLVAPLQHLPVVACAIGMMAVQAVIHFPVPSVSGQAVLTMPLLVPVSDLI